MKRSWFRIFHPLWLAAALLAALILVLTTTSARALPDGPAGPAEAPGGVEGLLYEPDGTTPVQYGWIDIHDVEGQPWMGTDTGTDGHFSIPNLPPGDYVLRAYPPPGSLYATSLPTEVQVLSGQWTSAVLRLTEARITGWVQDSETGGRVEGAFVVAHDEEWPIEQWWLAKQRDETDSNGEFKVGGVTDGVTYTLEVFPPPDSRYVPLPIEYTAVPPTSSVVLELRLPPTNVVGLVHNPAGDPVPGAGVVVFREDFWRETSADESGSFLFHGLPTGTLNVHAAPPWGRHGQGLIASEPFTFVITQTDTLVDVGAITLPHAYKMVTGNVVLAGTGAVVTDAMVWAHQLDGPGYADVPTHDPTGAFTVSLTGGEWHLGVDPLTWPVTWIFPGPPAWVVFDRDTTPQTQTVDLEVVPTDAWVAGQVRCPGDVPCSPGDPPHDAIWVELRNEDIGNGVELAANYMFTIPIPAGRYELFVHVEDPWIQGPGPTPVFVEHGQTRVVSDVVLLERDAFIVGRVYNESGVGVEGVPVVGWQPQGIGWGWTETRPNGVYTMPVIGGEWLVEPQPPPDMPYVFRHRPRWVQVAPGGAMSGVNFSLTNADALIEGVAVDAYTTDRIWGLDGWAWAEWAGTGAFFSDAPMRDGGFELKVKGGYVYNVGLNLPPHAPYVSGGTGPVPVAPWEHVTVSVPLEPKDAVIEGQLVIAGTSTPAIGVQAEVFGEDEEGHWAGVRVSPADAEYRMGVVSGTWHLRAWAEPASGYVAVPTTMVVPAMSGHTTTQNFEVWPIDAIISGTVKAPDGSPVEAFVFAEGESPFVGHFETTAQSDASGYFELSVPEGGYVVGAVLPGDELQALGWLNPAPIDVPVVSAAAPAIDLELRFRRLDGEIHGLVSFAPGLVVTPSHPAYVWGWTDTGEWAETEAAQVPGTNAFSYTMPVISNTVWHVGAVYEDWDNGVFYESPERVVPVPSGGHAVRHLQLFGPWPLPQPFIVSFDGSQMQTIIMPDGVELNIPGGSLVVSGTVTLFIFPTHELHPEPGQEMIGAGYEIWAIDENGQQITQFNKNVRMTFHYPPDPILYKQGLSEYRLVPLYYSTLVGRWILADSYVVDTVNNEITLQLDHFTKFGLASTTPGENRIYLPLIVKSFSST
jgi:hypothetical protein